MYRYWSFKPQRFRRPTDVARAVATGTDSARIGDKAGDARKIHGNSLDSPKETMVYQLKTKEADYLKTGMTSKNPMKRDIPKSS